MRYYPSDSDLRLYVRVRRRLQESKGPVSVEASSVQLQEWLERQFPQKQYRARLVFTVQDLRAATRSVPPCSDAESVPESAKLDRR